MDSKAEKGGRKEKRGKMGVKNGMDGMKKIKKREEKFGESEKKP